MKFKSISDVNNVLLVLKNFKICNTCDKQEGRKLKCLSENEHGSIF